MKRLSAPADGVDAGGLIQAAIDAMTGPGAIFLEAGTYHIVGTIRLNRPGVVVGWANQGKGATAGEWISPGRPVMPKSLYEAQRQARK